MRHVHGCGVVTLQELRQSTACMCTHSNRNHLCNAGRQYILQQKVLPGMSLQAKVYYSTPGNLGKPLTTQEALSDGSDGDDTVPTPPPSAGCCTQELCLQASAVVQWLWYMGVIEKQQALNWTRSSSLVVPGTWHSDPLMPQQCDAQQGCKWTRCTHKGAGECSMGQQAWT